MDLSAIARRLDAIGATTPWSRHGAGVHGGGKVVLAGRDGSAQVRERADRIAEFVAHAPQDVAALLVEIARLRELDHSEPT